MSRSIHSLRILGILFAFLLMCVAAPSIVGAQESTAELRATIRGMILSDPRASSLSQEQIDTVVSILAQEAQAQGMTSQDIQWRPQSSEQFTANGGAVATPIECRGGFLCTMAEAFGFIGVDATIPFTLGAASMALVWLLAEMIHRRRHPAQAPQPTTPASM